MGEARDAGALVVCALAAFCTGVLLHLWLPRLPTHPLAFAAAGAAALILLTAARARAPPAVSRCTLASDPGTPGASPARAACSRVLACLALGAAAAGLGFGLACWRAELRLADALPARWEGADILLRGVVDELPQAGERSTRFAFAVEAVEEPAAARVPSRLSLAWYAPLPAAHGAPIAPPSVHAGERWRLHVRLRRPHGNVNPAGFDLEAWLLAHGLRATGTVVGDGSVRLDAFAGRFGDYVERAREQVRARILAALPGAPYAGVLVALAIGDQRAIPETQWRVFQRTGVAHLISISGLHVTAFAAIAGAVVLWLVRRVAAITRRIAARKVAVAVGAVLATAYVLLAGAEVPAVRTLAMLLVAATGLWLGRPGTACCVWLWSLAAVLAIDPWAGLAPGFWLSFGAVGLLLFAGSGRIAGGPARGVRARAARALAEAGRTQWAVTIGLVPGTLALFQQVSLVSGLANAVAIPTVTAGVVPLALAGLVVPWDGLWRIAHAVLAVLMAVLERLAALPAAAWGSHAPGTVALVAALAGVMLLLAPRGVPGRWLGYAWLAPMLLVLPARPPPGSARVVALDVGQGTAAIVETATHALVYDTGPRYSDTADAGGRVIVPVLRARGVRMLDTLVVSHQDVDHSGGALSVLAAVPVQALRSSLPLDHPVVQRAQAVAAALRCVAGQAWTWDGVRFEMLHPTDAIYADATARTNDRSCVLRMVTAHGRALLTGDIEARDEALLLQAGAGALRADALLVPHHGSRTSSTPAFIAAVAPRFAVFTAGYRNRFGHPKPDVVARYVVARAQVVRTDTGGAATIALGPDGVHVHAERDVRHRYWYDDTGADD
jgi:competence protein ComEC